MVPRTRKLDYYHALTAEHGSLVLAQATVEGLTDLAAGRVLSEAQLDEALAECEDEPAAGSGQARAPVKRSRRKT
jgi:hypothetical protein